MSLTRDRKLDALGVVLVIGLVIGVSIAVFGAIEASNSGGETPTVNFTAERVNDSHVRLEHAGGDVVRGERLVITIDGRERVATFPPSVAKGDGTVVRVSEEHTIRVWWTGGRATRDRLDAVQT